MQSLAANQLDQIVEAYNRGGYVIVRGVIDQNLVEEARTHVDWLLNKHPDTRPEHLHNHLMTDDPFWVRLISDDRLLEIAKYFVGPDIALFASHYIAKRPFDGQAVLWHQDGSFWPLEPMAVVSFWLALDATTPENGCLRVIPGSHGLALQAMRDAKAMDNVLGREIDLAHVDEADVVDVRLNPGDVEIHHPNLIHGSSANTSERWRRGLTIRYIPTSTRILKAPFPSAFLLRGEATPGVNRYQPWPRYREGQHMPFRDWPAWNNRADRWNQRSLASLVSVPAN
jgi:ectoine hydroxylase-related dioxygenase (phytanoyl-CoA dioxygenase family)